MDERRLTYETDSPPSTHGPLTTATRTPRGRDESTFIIAQNAGKSISSFALPLRRPACPAPFAGCASPAFSNPAPCPNDQTPQVRDVSFQYSPPKCRRTRHLGGVGGGPFVELEAMTFSTHPRFASRLYCVCSYDNVPRVASQTNTAMIE
jgi:hypothetical protein